MVRHRKVIEWEKKLKKIFDKNVEIFFIAKISTYQVKFVIICLIDN